MGWIAKSRGKVTQYKNVESGNEYSIWPLYDGFFLVKNGVEIYSAVRSRRAIISDIEQLER